MAMKVLSLAPLPAELVKAFILQTAGVPDFDVMYGHEMSDNEMKIAMSKADVVFGDYTFKKWITEDIVSAALKVKLIQQPSAGYTHIDVDACTRKGIKVANTAGANTVSVAEHTIACALCLIRNMFYANSSTKMGRWEQMQVKPMELKGKVWGLVGFGRIGQAVSKRIKAFELDSILYYDIFRQDPSVEQELQAQYCELHELLGRSDIISIHTPLNDNTRNMIDEGAVQAIKKGAYLINVARAEVVDEKALASAVSMGRLNGAGIDVFSEEPITPQNPLLAVQSDKLILTPHVAGVSNEAAAAIMNMAAANVARVLKGEEPESVVNNL